MGKLRVAAHRKTDAKPVGFMSKKFLFWVCSLSKYLVGLDEKKHPSELPTTRRDNSISSSSSYSELHSVFSYGFWRTCYTQEGIMGILTELRFRVDGF
ncbi:hypothetical protein C1H46_005852 [Malus baccata]|uniref:Uncharacterized protein n=1 Tax=Malus baccata TaxID=106549 RepID=A0A540NBX8_MALBA|nr:hypothetical protein C1H46_005852 [Malus baccata]